MAACAFSRNGRAWNPSAPPVVSGEQNPLATSWGLAVSIPPPEDWRNLGLVKAAVPRIEALMIVWNAFDKYLELDPICPGFYADGATFCQHRSGHQGRTQ